MIPKTYQMAVMAEPGRIAFEDKMLPPLGEEDVLVKVKAAAICGSDLHLFKGKHPAVSLPVAVGHEAAGEVVAVGRGVTKHQVGSRVTIEPVIACGQCENCRQGRYNLCEHISFQYREGQGAFAPYFIVHQNYAHTLPAKVSFVEGALLEPLSVAMHAVQKSDLKLGQRTAVFGAGAVGLLVSILAKQATGVGSVVCDIDPFRLEKALTLGADMTINAMKGDPVDIIFAATQGKGVDVAFEAVGLDQTLLQALRSVRQGGGVTLLGIFEKPDLLLPVNIFVQREISLSGSQGYAWDFQSALRLLESGAVNLTHLITHRFPLDELQAAFQLLMSKDHHAVKVLIEMPD
jgi:2-desacetyl-2-hydroxyethyl bacteriochlorophyllide A dehydrogenase